MTALNPNLELHATIRTKNLIADLPELREVAFIDHRRHDDSQSEVRIRLHATDPKLVIQALQNAQAVVSRYFLTPFYLPGFWNDAPEDCVGGLLGADGCVSLHDSASNWRIVPLGDPLYTVGRPEADGEHSRHKPNVLGHGGGIPIVSDALLATLRQLGAAGETAPIIYRGSHKAAYNTVQLGFKRFLVQPQYEAARSEGFEFLPEGAPEVFGVCALLRHWPSRQGPDNQLGPSDERWYDIALSKNLCHPLRKLHGQTLLNPIFRRGGPTYQWQADFEAALLTMSS